MLPGQRVPTSTQNGPRHPASLILRAENNARSAASFPHRCREGSCSQTKTRRIAPPRSNRMRCREGSLLLLFLMLLAAERLELGEHGVDVEVVARPLGRLEFVLLGGLGGRQQGRSAIGGMDRLLLGRARHLEIELDLRA